MVKEKSRIAGLVFRLAFTPCLVETFVVAVASHLLLDFPWLWGFMLGFVLAAVSPAVVVPCLLQLQASVPHCFNIRLISCHRKILSLLKLLRLMTM